MAWVRDGAAPEQIKVTFIVSTKDYPELTRFILSLPYGKTSRIIREILSSAVRNAGQAHTEPSQTNSTTTQPTQTVRENHATTTMTAPAQPSTRQPTVNEVSASAADIIKNFDKMFPS